MKKLFLIAAACLAVGGLFAQEESLEEALDDGAFRRFNLILKFDPHDIYQGSYPLLMEMNLLGGLSVEGGIGKIYAFRRDLTGEEYDLDGYLKSLENGGEIDGLSWRAALRWYPQHRNGAQRAMEGLYFAFNVHQRRFEGIYQIDNQRTRKTYRISEFSPTLGYHAAASPKLYFDFFVGFGRRFVFDETLTTVDERFFLPYSIRIGFRL
ncbi:MAG: hypothetical protein AAF206_20875 [Bacteroidota bacterium]